jgi:hypothetical protein
VNVRHDDVDRIVNEVRRVLPGELAEWPGGWPDDIEAALIDAVLSIRARYGQAHNGVRGAVNKYRQLRSVPRADDLSALAAYAPEQLAQMINNRQVLSGGSSKAAAIVEAAGNLVTTGVRHAADLGSPTLEHKRAYTQVRGLGPVTWEYFLMLLGTPGVKADTWIVRFIRDTLQRDLSPAEARELLIEAANALNTNLSALDHAIWNHMRKRA